jgi:hypothetical protein
VRLVAFVVRLIVFVELRLVLLVELRLIVGLGLVVGLGLTSCLQLVGGRRLAGSLGPVAGSLLFRGLGLTGSGMVTRGSHHESVIPASPLIITTVRHLTGHLVRIRFTKLSSHSGTDVGLSRTLRVLRVVGIGHR